MTNESKISWGFVFPKFGQGQSGRAIGVAIAGVVAFGSSFAYAANEATANVQEAQPSAATPASGNAAASGQAAATIADVVVTATLTEESLQKVPVAVTVVDGKQAEKENLNNINDISTIVPSLNFRDGASNKDQGLFIRGVGTVTTSPGAEPSVSTVVDGVVLARPGQATLNLLDVDRIEVLRGPQGTLFGKNSSAGVVSVTTAQPTADLHGYVDLSYYDKNETRLKTAVSGAIVPGTVNGLFGVILSNYDGNVTNVFNGDTVNGSSHEGFRTKLEITPSSDFKALVAVDYLHSRETNPTGVVTSSTVSYPGGVKTSYPAFGGIIAPVVPSSDNRSVNINTPTHADDDNGGASLQLDWNVLDHTVTSITAYRFWNNYQYQDQDRTSVLTTATPQQSDVGKVNFDQFSQELRIASQKGQFIEYVGGLYYLHAADSESYRRTTTQVGPVVNSGFASYGITSDNIAAFNENTVNLTSSLRAIAGWRLIGDNLSYHHTRTSTSATAVPGIAISSPYTSDEVFKWGYADRAGLEYDVTPWATTYATYSHGYKGPAYNVFFNMVPATQGKVLDPETSESFEIGVKTKLFDDRLVLNAAAFHTDFENFQANFPNLIGGTVVTNLVNAGTVTSQGVEVDFTAKPTQSITLSGGVAYTDARITSTDIVGRNWPIEGQVVPFTPKWKANVRADYLLPLNDKYDIDFGARVRWQSDVQYDLAQSPDTIQKAFGIFDADITLTNKDDGWRVAVIGKNLFDKSYASYLQSSAATAASGTAGYIYRWVPRDDSRYFGINIRKEF
jgi:iron complex outermembrane receptor protein